MLPHDRAVEHDRAHADQHRVLDPAGMHDRLVADGDIVADHGRETAELGMRTIVADVHHAAVLDVGARADADEVDVATDHGAGPDRDVVAEHHVPDHGGRGIDIGAFAEGRQDVAIGADVHDAMIPAAALHCPAWTPPPIPR